MKHRLWNIPSLYRALAGVFCAALLSGSPGPQAAGAVPGIPVTLGDYRFSPDTLRVRSGETVLLELTNTDSLTPHNFTLRAREAGLDLDVDVRAGQTAVVELSPQAPGRYPFYCNNKLLFMKSHRERGMEGVLIVTPPGTD